MLLKHSEQYTLFQILVQGGFSSFADIFVLKRLLEGGLTLVGEGGLVDCPAKLGHLGQNLVRGGFHDQDEKG